MTRRRTECSLGLAKAFADMFSVESGGFGTVPKTAEEYVDSLRLRSSDRYPYFQGTHPDLGEVRLVPTTRARQYRIRQNGRGPEYDGKSEQVARRLRKRYPDLEFIAED